MTTTSTATAGFHQAAIVPPVHEIVEEINDSGRQAVADGGDVADEATG
ncbi:hypothetical protein [Acrocarpospora sp. B8E8]